MRLNSDFRGLDKAFWAHVRSISQKGGYTERGSGRVKTYTPSEIAAVLGSLDLDGEHIVRNDLPTPLGQR